MTAKHLRLFLAAALLFCLVPVLALANGPVRTWRPGDSNPLWGPVPKDRLVVHSFYNNGNIVSKYYPNGGLLYHAYQGNPNKDVITNKTWTDVIILPPEGAHHWRALCYQGKSLTDETLMTTIEHDLAAEKSDWDGDFSKGFPYYQRATDLFDSQNTSDTCTPIQLAAAGKGNLCVAAWYRADNSLLRVDWLWETCDSFSVPRHEVEKVIFPTFPSESAVPTPVTQPSLVNPTTPRPMQFSLVAYLYPSDRGNTVFMELMIVDDKGNPEFDFDHPVVIYLPYPEGHGPHSNYHYQIKHYLDNTRTRFEMLKGTPTEKGIRMAVKTFSPFELSWSENTNGAQLPDTGDNSSMLFWSALACLSLSLAALHVRRRKEVR